MMIFLFVKGIVAGFAIAAPIGPMALLCIRRTMDCGWRAGFSIGAGIATGDMLLALTAALGLSGISRLMLEHERLLHLTAAPLLIYLGLRTLLRAAPANERRAPLTSLPAAYGTAILLTLSNPPTLVAFAALFTIIAPVGRPHLATAFATTAGIGAGSLLWWLALTSGVAFFRRSVTPRLRLAISAISGIALAAFGISEIFHS